MSKIDWSEILKELKLDSTNLIVRLIIIAAVLILAKVLLKYITRLTSRIIRKAEKMEDRTKAKELLTSMTLSHSVARYAIYFIAICIIVNQLGYGTKISSFVTAAGVGAIVISLGAQSIIKDIIAGAFIMFERQYGVGDFVKINEYEGTVTSLAMRCTYLKTWKGQKIIIPNGQIATVVNYSVDYNMATVEVPTPYEENSERMRDIITEVAEKYYQTHQEICYEKPFISAISSFGPNSANITVYQKAVGRNHYQIERDLRMAIKKRFDEEGISIPYSQIVVHQDKK